MFRKVLFLYLLYVGLRMMQLGLDTSEAPLRDPRFLEATLERFYQMGVGSKVLVIFIGVPLYLWAELIPRESAIMVSVCAPILWENVLLPLLHTVVETLVRVSRFIVRSCQWFIRKTLWLIAIVAEKISPLWDALCLVMSWTMEGLHNLCLLVWDGLCLVVPRIIQGLHNLCLLIWDQFVVPLWEVVLLGRDLCLAVWQPVREWLVERFYRLCAFIYYLGEYLLTVIGELSYAFYAYMALTTSVSRDFVISLFSHN